jgi:rubrerythrin
LKKALESVQGKELREIFEFSISVEVNAVDLYIKMERRVEGKDAKEVFQALSNQERNHLKRLTRAFQEG